MRAAIYCRVSTEDQEREGTSLQSQLEACKKLAQEQGFEVPQELIILETFSGRTLERPKLDELRQWVRDKRVDVVIAYTLDRLSRDPVHFIILQEELEREGVEILLVAETLDDSDVGRLITHIKGYAAKLEAEKIRERTMRGKMARAKSGRLLGGRSVKLYGYNYISGKGVGEGVRYVYEGEAKWVKEIYRWFVEDGLTLGGIVSRLRALGVPSPSGNDYWSRSTVHTILTRPAYTGRTYAFTQSRIGNRGNKNTKKGKVGRLVVKPREQWLEISGATPPIISEELFNQAKTRLQKNKELASRNTKRNYLLSGYVFCQHCGRRYTGASIIYLTKSGTKHQRYYRCSRSRATTSPISCHNRLHSARYLERAVWEEIERILLKPEVILAESGAMLTGAMKHNSYQSEMEAVEARLHRLEMEKDRLWKAFKFTGDETKFRNEIKAVMADIQELERRRLEIERQIDIGKQTELNADGVKRFCELARANLAEFTFENKRLTLEALQIKVWINKRDVTIEGVIPVAPNCIESNLL